MTSIAKLKDRARSFEQDENWQAAIEAYQQVLEQGDSGEDFETDLGLANRIGDLYLRLGQPEEAVFHYILAADKYADAGFFNNAIALCNKALRHRPDLPEIYLKLSDLCARQGFQTDARRWILEYADRQMRSGRAESALTALSDFADMTDDPEVREALADQLLGHGHKDKAIRQLTLAFAVRSERGETEAVEAITAKAREIDPAIRLEDGPEVEVKEADDRMLDWEHGQVHGLETRTEEVVAGGAPAGLEGFETTNLDAAPEDDEVELGSAWDDPPDAAAPAAPQQFGTLDLPGDEPSVEEGEEDDLDTWAAEAPEEQAEADEAFDPWGAERPDEDEAEQTELGAWSTEASVEEAKEDELDAWTAEAPVEQAGTDEAFDPWGAGPLDEDEPEEAELDAWSTEVPVEEAEEAELDAWSAEAPVEEVEETELDAWSTEAPVEEAEQTELDAWSTEAPVEEAGEDELDAWIAEAPVEQAATDEAFDPWGAEPLDEGEAEETEMDAWSTEAPVEEAEQTELDAWSTEAPVEEAEDDELDARAAEAEAEEGEDEEEPEPLPLMDFSFDEADEAEERAVAALEEGALLDFGVTEAEADEDEGIVDVGAVLELARELVGRGLHGEALRELSLLPAESMDRPTLDQALMVVKEIIRADADAIPALQRRVEYAALLDDPGLQVKAYAELGDALARLGAETKARAIYQRVLELDPGHEPAARALARLRGEGAEEPAAEEVEQGVVETGSGVLELVEEELPEPAGELEPGVVEIGSEGLELIEEEPSEPAVDAWPEREEADAGTEPGDLEPVEADPEFEAMLSQFRAKVSEDAPTDDAGDHYDLGLAFKEMGLLDEAIGEFQTELERAREPVDRLKIYEELGQCHIQKGHYTVAVTVLERALDVPTTGDEDLLGIFYHLGTCYTELGQREEAREAYRRILAIDDSFADVPDRMAQL